MKWGCCMISNCQKHLAILLTFICVIVLYPQSPYATEAISQRETIRVGFFEMDGYHMQDETRKFAPVSHRHTSLQHNQSPKSIGGSLQGSLAITLTRLSPIRNVRRKAHMKKGNSFRHSLFYKLEF